MDSVPEPAPDYRGRVRVVHLTSRHRPDDVRIFVKECRSLAKAGFDVHLVAPGATNGRHDGVVLHGFAGPGGVRPLRITRRLWRAWRAARAVNAELCHFHEPELIPIALLLKLRGTRIVYDAHEDHVQTLDYQPYKFGKRMGYAVLEALARRVCDGFVAATPEIARAFPPDRTIEIANYAVPEEFAQPVHDDATGANVVYVGGLSRARGVREVVRAAAHLTNPQARVVLIGAFSPLELENEARSLPGWSRVEYLGWLDRRAVSKRLAVARAGLVILHPERNYEHSLPTKLFEYMSAGLPVVISDFPFFRDLLDPIGCALYVNPLDPVEIAAAIDALLADEPRAREMGQRGAAAVRDRLNWNSEAPKLIELYERLSLPQAA